MTQEMSAPPLPWAAPLTAVLLLPLALTLSHLLHWPPGAATLLLLSGPLFTNPGSTSLRSDRCLTLLLGLSLAGEVLSLLLARPVTIWPLQAEVWVLPGLMLINSYVLPRCLAAESVPDSAAKPAAPVPEAVADDTEVPVATIAHVAAPANPRPADKADTPRESAAEMPEPMWELTLREIGRRVSTTLDLARLIPIIGTTAQRLLNCRLCAVYLWDRPTQQLRLAEPQLPGSTVFHPDHQSGLVAHVLATRKVWLKSHQTDADFCCPAVSPADTTVPDGLAPLIVGDDFIGLLALHGLPTATRLQARLLQVLSHLSALGVKNSLVYTQMQELARRDGLTGLLHHAGFHQQLTLHIQAALEHDEPVAILMSDIDHFKAFNDRHGHQAGDHVLREVAHIWQKLVPENAACGRYGGEEFICVLPGWTAEAACELGESLRHTIETVPISFAGRPLSVTASFGAAELGPAAQTTELLVQLADRALYVSKRQGRNRVTLWTPGLRTVGWNESTAENVAAGSVTTTHSDAR